jgi:putative ABC transport system permease protein
MHDIKLLLRLSLSEMRLNLRFWALLIFMFSLGVTGFLVVLQTKAHIQNFLEDKGQQFLAADFVIYARRSLDSEKNIISNALKMPFKTSQSFSFYSMVSSTKQSRLLEVVAVDKNYPLYGQVTYSDSKDDKSVLLNSLPENAVTAFTELKQLMQLETGDSLKIGSLSTQLVGFISEDMASGFASASFAPRVYINISDLEATQLLKKGSTFFHRWYFSLEDPRRLKEALQILKDLNLSSDVSLSSTLDEEQNLTRVLRYLSDYLSLTTLVTLALLLLGGHFLFLSYLQQQQKSAGVLKSLGFSFQKLLSLEAIKALLISTLVASLALIFTRISLNIFLKYYNELLPFKISAKLSPFLFFIAFGFCLFSMLVVNFNYFIYLKYAELKNVLLNINTGFSAQKSKKINKIKLGFYLLLLLLFWGTAVYFANSLTTASLFVLALALAYLLIFVFVQLFFVLFNRMSLLLPFTMRLPLLSILRQKQMNSLAITTTALLVFLSVFILIVKNGLEEELLANQDQMPELFLFDIQSEQVEKLQQVVVDSGVELQSLSPLIRARLESVNGENNLLRGKTANGEESLPLREDQERQATLNRGFNLSYRGELDASEALINGDFPITRYSESSGFPAAVSVEQRFAKRIGVKLGDRLVFDVQGVGIETEVRSIRSVRWTSFQPNFFILVQPGVLEDAPKTFLASINNLNELQKEQLQNDIGSEFPNISLLDIGRLSDRIRELLNSASIIFVGIFSFCLLIVLFLLIMLVGQICRQKSAELSYLRILGFTSKQAKLNGFMTASFIAFLGVLVGGILSVVFSTVIFYELFTIKAVVSWFAVFGVLGAFFVAFVLMYVVLLRQQNRKSLISAVRV